MDIIKRSSGFVGVFEKLAFDLVTVTKSNLQEVTDHCWGESGQEHKKWTIAEHCLQGCLLACSVAHDKLTFYTTLVHLPRMLLPTTCWAFSHESQQFVPAMAIDQSDLGSSSVEIPSFQVTLGYAKLAIKTNQKSAIVVNTVLIVIKTLLYENLLVMKVLPKQTVCEMFVCELSICLWVIYVRCT